LPAKSKVEAEKHKQEYEKMVNIAKKKGDLNKTNTIIINFFNLILFF
jgi:hypothetical protein